MRKEPYVLRDELEILIKNSKMTKDQFLHIAEIEDITQQEMDDMDFMEERIETWCDVLKFKLSFDEFLKTKKHMFVDEFAEKTKTSVDDYTEKFVYVYDDDLYIEIMNLMTYKLTLNNKEFISGNLEGLEKRLYEFYEKEFK